MVFASRIRLRSITAGSQGRDLTTPDRRASDTGDLVHRDNPAMASRLASTAAKCRRPRSSSFEPNSRHLCRIASRSIITVRYSAMP
jgi:hypothetical protein